MSGAEVEDQPRVSEVEEPCAVEGVARQHFYAFQLRGVMTPSMVGVMTPGVQKCRICITEDATTTRCYTAPNVPGTLVIHSTCDQHFPGLHVDMMEAGWEEVDVTPVAITCLEGDDGIVWPTRSGGVDIYRDFENLSDEDKVLLMLWVQDRTPKGAVTATTLADLYAVVGRIKANALFTLGKSVRALVDSADSAVLCGQNWGNIDGDATCDRPDGHDGPHQGNLFHTFRMDADGWRGERGPE